MTRKNLAELNESFRTAGSRPDFEVVTEYRVGKWGLAYSRDGFNGRGQGGDKLHLSVATVITEIHPDYCWQTYCAASVRGGAWDTAEQIAARRAHQIAEHGCYGHYCEQPKVGDVIAVRPVCRFENVRGTGAWSAELADTDAINCLNCRSGFFGEQVDGVAERRAVREQVESRKAARPLPARCMVCGETRPQTAATRKGEILPCSWCKEDLETIYWVETTGYSCKYFAECGDARLLEMSLAKETEAYDNLVRREARRN